MRSFTLATTLLFAAAVSAVAGDGKHGGVHCPRCHEPCYATVTKGTETKHCWNVEYKTICIPKVTFPWEVHGKGKAGGKDCAVPAKCGRTKTVRVLVKEEYECSVCKYSWDPSSFKGHGHKSHGRDLPPGAPADAQPDVPAPPPVEASLDPMPARRVPSVAEPSAADQPPALTERSYFEILTGFFSRSIGG
jgi:hypothetical protein